MSTNVATITAKVKSLLGTLESLKAVYDYSIDLTAGYPCAVVRDGGWRAEFSDTQRNRRVYTIEVYLFQEFGEAGFTAEKAARVLRELQDEVITLFDTNITLDGTVLFVEPISGTPVRTEDRPEKTLGVIVTIECTKLVTRTA